MLENDEISKYSGLRFAQVKPSHPDTQVQVLGEEQVPLFRHDFEQTAATERLEVGIC